MWIYTLAFPAFVHLGWKELLHFQGQRVHCTKLQVFISEDSLWMGIEVLHSLHVFFDGFPRYSTFVPLIIWLVSCILFSSLVLLCCFSLFCIPFWFLIYCNYLSKKKIPSLCALKKLGFKVQTDCQTECVFIIRTSTLNQILVHKIVTFISTFFLCGGWRWHTISSSWSGWNCMLAFLWLSWPSLSILGPVTVASLLVYHLQGFSVNYSESISK